MAVHPSQSSPKRRPFSSTLKRKQSRRRMLMESLESRNLLAQIAYESFGDYTAGAQLETAGVGLNGGIGWTGAWNVTDSKVSSATIIGSGLNYAASEFTVSGGDRALQVLSADEPNPLILITRAFPTQSDTIYFSFLYNNTVDANPAASSSDFMQLGLSSATGTDPTVSVTDRDTNFQLRSTTNSANAVLTGITSTAGQTYMLVVKAEKLSGSTTYNRLSLFVDPQTRTEPGTANAVSTVNSTLDLGTSAFLMIRQAFNDVGDTYVFDEIRLGTAYTDVLPPPPPPVLGPGEILWTGAGAADDWDDPANWSGNNVPDLPTEIALIYTEAPTTIDLEGANYNIGGLRFFNSYATIVNGTLSLPSVQNEGGLNAIDAVISGTGAANVEVTSGSLALNNAGNIFDATDTVTIESSAKLLVGAAGLTDSALGDAGVVMNGGQLEFVGQNVPVNDAFAHFGYHTGSDTPQNLNNNGGLMGGIAGPTAGPNFFAQTVLTAGPGNRGIDFNDDADFLNTFAVNVGDNYSNLFLATLTVPAGLGGDWAFRSTSNDDRGGLWIDLDQDGVFELASAFDFTNGNTGTTSNGELIVYESGTARTANLLEGESYLVAVTHREGTGGSTLEMLVNPPGALPDEMIRPLSPNQAGFWSALAIQPLTLTNSFQILGDAMINAGNLVSLTLDGVSMGNATTTAELNTVIRPGNFRINNLELLNDSTVDTSGAGTVTISNITDGAGAFDFTKSGTSRLILDTSNAVDGEFLVNAGTLQINADGALGPVAAGTSVANGATLQIASTASYNTAEPLALDGTLLAAGNVTFAGPITTVGNGGIVQHSNSPAGTLTLPNTLTLTQPLTVQGDGNVTAEGVVSGGGNITKAGNGTLRPTNNANNFTGAIVINDGKVSATTANALGSISAGTTVNAAGTLEYDGNFQPALEPLSIASVGEGRQGALRSVNGPSTRIIGASLAIPQSAVITSATAGAALELAGVITVGGTNTYVLFEGAGDILVSSSFGTPTSSLIKNGTGTLTLATANTYQGTTTINSGALIARNSAALGTGTAGLSIKNGAALGLEGGITIADKPAEVNGNGGAHPGVIYSISGDNRFTGNIVAEAVPTALNGTPTGEVQLGTEGGNLSLEGDLDMRFSRLVLNPAANTTLTLTGDISADVGTTILPEVRAHIFNGNTIRFPGDANTTSVVPYSGEVHFTNEAAFLAALGPDLMFVNGSPSVTNPDNYGTTFSGLLTIDSSISSPVVQFRATSSDDAARIRIDINRDGDTSDANEDPFGQDRGGTFTTTVAGGIPLVPGVAYPILLMHREGGGGSVLRPEISLDNGSTWQRLATGTSGDVRLNTQYDARPDVIKTGAGTAVISGNNTYTGTTSVNAGTLVAGHSAALGTISVGTNVAAGASLALDNSGIDLADDATLNNSATITLAEPITVSINDAIGAGVLSNIRGNNSINGNITAIDFTPPPLPVDIGLELWLNASNLASVVAADGLLDDGDAISGWNDTLVGSNAVAQNAVQTNASKQPVWVASSANGQPAIRFTGVAGNEPISDDLLLSGLTLGNNVTIFAVVQHAPQHDDGGSCCRPFFVGNGDGYVTPQDGYTMALQRPGIGGGFRLDGPGISLTNGSAVTADGNFAVYSLSRNGTVANGTQVFQNGNVILTGTAGGNATETTYSIGGENGGNAARQYTGDIPEIIAFNRTLSTTEREAVEAYLLARYVTPAASGPGKLTLTSQADTLTILGNLSMTQLTVSGPGDTVVSSTVVDPSAGATSIMKDGTGALTLTNGSNSYTGDTTVAEGRLLVANGATGSATGTGNVTVEAGGLFGGDGAIAGSVTAQFGGTIDPGLVDNGVGTLRIGGDVNLQPGSTATTDVVNGTSDQTIVTGTLNIADGQVIPDGDVTGAPLLGVPYLVTNQLSSVPLTAALGGLPQDPNGFLFNYDGFAARIFYNFDAGTSSFGLGNDIAIVFDTALVANDDPTGGQPNAVYTTGEDSLLNVSSGNGVLANDTGDGLLITGYSATTANGAAVVVNQDGSFSYNPLSAAALQALAAGATINDTFTYTVAERHLPGIATTATATQGGAYSVSGTDLLTGLSAAVTGTLAGSEGTSSNPLVLTNGQFGTPGSPLDLAETLSIGNNTTLTYTLDTITNPLGYDLSQIDVFSGWRDNGRVQQNYSVSYTTVDNPGVFVPLTSVNFAATNSSAVSTITATNGLVATRVAQLRFDFGVQQNGFVGYREIDVVGAPTAYAQSATATVTITVNGQNDLPLPADDTFAVSGSTANATLGNVLANDQETDTTDTITVVAVNNQIANVGTPINLGAGGIITIGADGQVTFQSTPQSVALGGGQVIVNSLTYISTDSQIQVGTGTSTSQSSPGAFAVSGSDLLTGRSATVTGSIGQEGTSNDTSLLTNGQFGTPDFLDTTQTVAIGSGATLMYALDTATNPFGYDITSVDVFSGWQDAGRVNQNYTLEVETFANPGVFTAVAGVNAVIGDNSGRTSITASGNTLLATGVTRVRFVFGPQQNGHVGYREIDVHGSPTGANVTINVTGANEAPTVAVDTGAVSGNEGSPIFNSGTFNDLDFGDNVTITASVGAITSQTPGNSGTWNWSFDATDDTAGSPVTVTITATDALGLQATTTFTYQIDNVVPTLTISGAATTNEGSVYTLNLNSSDPGDDALTSWTINWGDGSPLQTVPGNTTSVTHTYGDGPLAVQISATAFDEDNAGGMAYVSNTLDVNVQNVPPAPYEVAVQVNGVDQDTSPGFVTVVPGLAVTFVVSTTDPAFDHVDGPFTFEIDFGDGSAFATASAALENDPVSFTHVYTTYSVSPGFEPQIRVTDADSGVSAWIPLTRVVSQTLIVIDDVLYVGGGDLSDRILVSVGRGGLTTRINNRLFPAQNASSVVVFGNDGADTITFSGSIPVPVTFYGGEGNDYLSGSRLGDTLDGGAGRDRLFGGGGNDTLLGGDGNDSISGGVGNDYIAGDEQIDILGGTELEDGSISVAGDIIPSAEPGNDSLSGDNGNDTIFGNAGNDFISGGAGNDIQRGGEGSDRMQGGSGNDLLTGDAGSDLLQGGAGRDVLIGGLGLDIHYGGTSADLIFGGTFEEDSLDLAQLLMDWGSSATADDALFGLQGVAEDDNGTPDSLNGQGDGDWFLTFLRDFFQVSSERRDPNQIFPLD